MILLGIVSQAPAQSFTIAAQWQAVTHSDTGILPPNPSGAVGPTQVLVAVDGRLRLFDKTGNPNPAFDVTDASFFGSVSGGAGTTHPHAKYDRLSGRWFITEITTTSASNRILIAVSAGPTITDSSSFTFFQFQHDLVGAMPNIDTGYFAADPTLAVDVNALYIGVIVRSSPGGAAQSTTGHVIGKADLLAGTLTATAFRGLSVGAGSGPWAPVGVDNDDPAATEGYFIGPDNASFGTLMLRRVSTPGSTPSISGNIRITVPMTSQPVPQAMFGSTWPLDTMDHRLLAAMIKKNKITGVSSLWTAHGISTDGAGVAHGSTPGTLNAARWYQIDNTVTTPTLTQSATILVNAPHNQQGRWLPSAAANGQGHVVIGQSTAWQNPPGPPIGPGFTISTHLGSDPLGTMTQDDITQAGSVYNPQSGHNQRWGEYTQTVVDPTDDQTIWSFQEYANATNSWAGVVLKLLAPPPFVAASANRVNVVRSPGSTTVTISGRGFFDPGAGFANRIAASVTGGVVVNSVTLVDAGHVVLNISTATATLGPKIVTIINPDGQQSTASRTNFTVVSQAVPGDFDGDGHADLAVYTDAGAFGPAGPLPGGFCCRLSVPGDYDGDGRLDYASWQPSIGAWIRSGHTDYWGVAGDIPAPGDYDGDGTTDLAVYRPGTATWWIRGQAPIQWGAPGDIPVAADYDGDGRTDIAVFRPSAGYWYVRTGASVQFGQAGDIPVPADYNGDGRADFAVYRPSAVGGGPWWHVREVGSWPIGAVGDIPAPQDVNGDGQVELVVYRPSTGFLYSYFWATDSWQTASLPAHAVPVMAPVSQQQSVSGDVDRDRRRDPAVFRPSEGRWWVSIPSGYFTQQWGGAPGDVPVPGDYDGDGKMDLAVYNTAGRWWILQSAGGYTSHRTAVWGLATDIPLVGDFDGDGRSDMTVYRPSDASWWTLLSSTDFTTYRHGTWGVDGDIPITGDFDGDGMADMTVFRPDDGAWWSSLSAGGFKHVEWGVSGDLPVPGDYNGDGMTDAAVYRPSDGTWWLLFASASRGEQWGVSGDMPVPGDYDGDGKTDIAVYRPSDGTWYVRLSSTDFQMHQRWEWGVSTDIPVPSR